MFCRITFLLSIFLLHSSFSFYFLSTRKYAHPNHPSPYNKKYGPCPSSSVRSDQLFAVNSEDDAATSRNDTNVVRSRFDRVLDDFIGKRFGAGEAFYGKRTSTLSDDELDQIRQRNALTTKRPSSLSEYCRIDQPFKDNAVLVVGHVNEATSSEVLQWTVYDLLEKGFTVRVGLVGSEKETEKTMLQGIRVFGLPSTNVDLIELWNDGTVERFEKALEGVQAVVLCDYFSPVTKSVSPTLPLAAERLLSVARQQRIDGIGRLQKIGLCSKITTFFGFLLL